MDSLDLDIHNYTIADIETFFQFKPKSKYSAADIEFHEYRIREQLLQSGHINKRYKRDLIAFLETAKEWLTLVKCPPPKPPTVIPKNHPLDTINTPVSQEPLSRQTELVTRPEPDMNFAMKRDVNQGDFFTGILNPMHTRTLTKCLTIDTRFRDSYLNNPSTDFMIQFPTKFHKVVSMELSSFEIPIAFYNISSAYGNHFFTLSVTDTMQRTLSQVIVIPDGNYRSIDLVKTLNGLFQANSSSLFSNVDCSLNTMTGKCTFTANASLQSMTLDFTQTIQGIYDTHTLLSTKLGWVLGFIQPSYSKSTTYTGESVVEVKTIRYIYLSIDDFHNNATHPFVSVFENSLLNQHILARISVRGEPFDMIRDHDFSYVVEPRRYFGPVDIQRFRVRLLDEQGRILSMNHANYSFCLTLKLLYDL